MDEHVTNLNDRGHEVEVVAEGHQVEVLCDFRDPRDPGAKHIFAVNNMLYKVSGRVKYCPHCGSELE